MPCWKNREDKFFSFGARVFCFSWRALFAGMFGGGAFALRELLFRATADLCHFAVPGAWDPEARALGLGPSGRGRDLGTWDPWPGRGPGVPLGPVPVAGTWDPWV